MNQPNGANDDGDRLSALPDCLLHTVMSFLSARQAVQTCVLSRRWRKLSLSMPCLDIDGDDGRWILRGFRYRPAALEIAIAFKLPFLSASSASRLVLDGGFGECIRSWCPVLEAMELKACTFELKEIVTSTIKSLAIIVDRRRGSQVGALIYRMDSLVEASISGTRFGSDFDKTISTLISSLLNVRDLLVCRGFSQWYEWKYGEHANFQTFHKLTTLDIYECDLGPNLHISLSFLQNTPNLEKVILKNCEISDHSRKRKRTPRANRNQIHSKCRSPITSKSQISKIIKMTYEEDGISDLMELLLRNWRKFEDHTIRITKI
uniref:F-box domain-containing protein n=1 Tax=Oryza punctata TaxID=4537 RepID=A0A0E0KN56_ORYPU